MDVRQLRRLERVNLDGNALTTVPAGLCELLHLTALSMVANRVTHLRNEFSQLSQLRELYLSQNLLVDVPRQVCARLQRLEQLALGGNRLVELPDSIGALVRLERLDVSDNRLTWLPADLSACAALRALYAHGNQLNRLPDNIGDLRSLTVLSLHSNELVELPVSLGKLVNLEHLSLFGNRLLSVEQLAPLHGTLRSLALVRDRPDNALPPVANVNLADSTDCAQQVFDIAQECAARRPSTFQERSARLAASLRVVRAARVSAAHHRPLQQVAALRRYGARRAHSELNVLDFDSAALARFVACEHELALMQVRLRGADVYVAADVDERDRLRALLSTELADTLLAQAQQQVPVELFAQLGQLEELLQGAGIGVAEDEGVVHCDFAHRDSGMLSGDLSRLLDAVELWCTDQQSHLDSQSEQTEHFIGSFLAVITRDLAPPGTAVSAPSDGELPLEQLFECALVAAEQERVWQQRTMSPELRAQLEALVRATARDVAVLHANVDAYDGALRRAALCRQLWQSGGTRIAPTDETLAREFAKQLDLQDAKDDAALALRRSIERRRSQPELEPLRDAARAARRRWVAHQPALEKAMLELAQATASVWPELRTRYPEARLGELLASGDGSMMRTLDHYDNVRELPSLGRHTLLHATLDDQPCVLKRFNVMRPTDRASFFKEVRRLRALAHPHVVRLDHVFVHDQAAPIRATHGYLQMPLYAGGDLWQWRASMERDDEERRTVLRQALLGLAHVHRMGVVHCDIKPENIFVDADGSAKLGDFDVSKDDESRTTQHPTSVGHTVLYLAPELVRDPRAKATTACDMFAFGLTLYDVFTAQVVPVSDDELSSPQVTLERDQDVSPDCELLLMRAAGEQLRALASALLDESASARPDALQALAHRYFVLAQPTRDPERDVRACATCFARVWRDEGVECKARHFMCATCTAGWADAFCERPRDRVHADGGLRCSTHGCVAPPFTSSQLAQLLRGDALTHYLETLRAAEEHHITLHLEAQYQERLADELERQRVSLQNGEQRDDAVQRHRTHIVDNILTLRCPRRGCRKAFINFEACFALKCSDQAGNGCGAHFCAWCLQQSPDWNQNHAHVAHCPYNLVGEVFGRREMFDECHRTRRQRLVEAYLRALPHDVAAEVRAASQRDWEDLGLHVALEADVEQ
jgi:serine/threonine protein kinase